MTQPKANNTTALFTHPDCVNHAMPGHPERPERLLSVMERLRSSGLLADMQQNLAAEITDQQIAQVHPSHYIEQIRLGEPASGVVKVEQDTYMNQGSLRAAKLAAGAGVQATQAVLNGDVSRAFCAIRPPGHHAEVAAAFGFCLFNNVAIAAETALQHPSVNRVAIVDFDVHHCNGTVDIFKDRDEVLVCSSFQADFYPFRYLDFNNHHIIATPLDSGTKSAEFRRRIEAEWLPALNRHKPDMIFISAGFDAHTEDPLGEINLLEDDYIWITELLMAVANEYAGGRVVSTLEGGYSLEALARSVEAHVKVLLRGK
jgi:acetoin utilization deacetylase AcuC-like enzyme